MELPTKTKTEHKYIICCHVWGCTVLNWVQKCNTQSKYLNGIISQNLNFWGFPDKHYYFEANVQNLATGYISTQYHIVFENIFHTFFKLGKMKWSQKLFVINVLNTVEIFMLRKSQDNIVYLVPLTCILHLYHLIMVP